MRHKLARHCLALALALVTSGHVQADKQITYAIGENTYTTGTSGKKAETIDLAMLLKDPALVGLQVKAVRIAFPFTEGLTEATAWLSAQLPAIRSSKAQDPDICSQAFDIREGYTEVTFAQPYTLTAEGVYVGYSFSVAAADEAPEPIVATDVAAPGAFLIHSTKIYRTAWQDRYGKEGALALQVVLAGEGVKENAVGVTAQQEVNTRTGEPATATIVLANHGAAGATQVDYTVAVAGQQVSAQAAVALKPVFGAQTELAVALPAMPEKGAYAYTVTIDRVNGQPNEDPAATATGDLRAFNTLPVHRPVLEEYTGTWCGYCPRGFVGLEEMNRLYPEDFIGISYHNGDPMEIMTDYPSSVPGFPDAWLDRWYETDAFCGDSDYGTFGIDKVWKEVGQVFAPAAVEVESAWTDENTLRAQAHIAFPLASDENPYRVGFALVADGLSGTGSSWRQSNYYSGVAGWPSSMDAFVGAGSYVADLVFNDVIIEGSAIRGIEGSLQAPIEEDVAQTVTYDFDLSSIKAEIIPADRSQLRVVALLIDTRTGAIANANKVQAGGTTVGLAELAAEPGTVAVRTTWNDLSGRPVALPRHGLFIQTVTQRDGTVRTRKVQVP